MSHHEQSGNQPEQSGNQPEQRDEKTELRDEQRARTLRIGSRGSQLALWQANHIAALLRSRGHAVSIEIIKTLGDRLQDSAFEQRGEAPADGKGIFIKEIEEALADGRIDLAVHSLKDLPTEIDARFVLAAIPERANPADVLIGPAEMHLSTLPQGARVGTTSPRRQAQLLRMRGDLRFVEMRGNVDTRLRKLAEGQADALVLAAAGLERLGRTEWVRQRFTPEEMCPAPGQGALAIETRSTDTASRDAVGFLDDRKTRFCVEAERTVLRELGGGCSVPIGAHCAVEPAGWRMWGSVLSPDGKRSAQVNAEAGENESPSAFGMRVVEELLAQGARELLASGE
ncbi:MAG: hydroxymethylbilane synthase [Acidobacteriaceae bacterium]